MVSFKEKCSTAVPAGWDGGLASRLTQHAVNRADESALIWLEDGEVETRRLSFLELKERAEGVARWITSCSSKGDRVILAFPSSLEFVVAFVACLLSGRVAEKGLSTMIRPCSCMF